MPNQAACGARGATHPVPADVAPKTHNASLQRRSGSDDFEDARRALVDVPRIAGYELELPCWIGFIELFDPPLLFVDLRTEVAICHRPIDDGDEKIALVRERFVDRRNRYVRLGGDL